MGRTIFVTIHQPSYAMITRIDRIILLSRGGIIFYGICHDCIEFFDRLGYTLPPKTNPTDFFLDTISMDTRTTESVQASSKRIDDIKTGWKERSTTYPVTVDDLIDEIYFKGSKVAFYDLLHRNLTDYMRNKSYLCVKVFQKVFFLFIFGLAYVRMGYTEADIYSRKGSYIFLVLNNLFGICAPISNVFPMEKKAIVRERRSGMYNGYTAFLAKLVAEIPINFAYELTYVPALYWMIGLNSNAVYSVGSTSSIPSWLRWLIYVSPAYYAYTALLQNQLDGTEFTTDGGSTISGEEVIAMTGSAVMGTWWCIFLIWRYTIGWLIAGSVALQVVTRNSIEIEKQQHKEV